MAPRPIKVDAGAHSRFGPSASDKWMGCAGYYQATKDMPPSDSIYAAEGTAAHHLSEWAREKKTSAHDWLGKVIRFEKQTNKKGKKKEYWEFEVNGEMADCADRFTQFCDDAIDPDEADYIAFEGIVHYDDYVPEGFGTADDIRIKEPVCRISDFKYGKGRPVHAKNNKQLLSYAVGVLHDIAFMYDIEEFELCIFQPRLGIEEVWTVSLDDVLAHAAEMAAAHEEAMKPNPVFTPGPHCQNFCPLNGNCIAQAHELLKELDDPERLMTDTSAGEISDNELPLLLPYAKRIIPWAKAVIDRATEQLNKHKPVGDWKLVAGRSSRDWEDEEAAVKKLTSRAKTGGGLKKADVQKVTMISPAEAEKLLGKKHPALEGLIKVSEGAPTLAPPDDPRPPFGEHVDMGFEDES